MEKDLNKKIQVMTHYLNGGEVEFSFIDEMDKCVWSDCKNPQWNWVVSDYRIKEQKKKVVIEKWLMQGDTGCYFVLEGSISYFEGYQNITKIRLLETYEVEL